MCMLCKAQNVVPNKLFFAQNTLHPLVLTELDKLHDLE